MASKSIHLEQAEHNQETATELKDSDFYDWGCTAAFYSALHYAEASFNDDPKIKHGEQLYRLTMDKRKENDYSGGVHAFRAALIGKFYPKAETAYRQLLNVSNMVRYLESDKVATSLLKRSQAEKLITEDLPKVKTELGH